MKIYLARHGRTNYNDLGLNNADPSVDVHLTPVGIEQAEALAQKLHGVSFERIFVSELRRTQQTAEIVNRAHNVPVEIDGRLNDGRSGFESQPYEVYDKVFDVAPDKWNVRFNDGESVEDIKLHVREFLDELRVQSYDSVLIVTSLWIVFAIMAILKGLSNEEAWGLEVVQGGYFELEL
jgi:probable phosphoglycerate mutase